MSHRRKQEILPTGGRKQDIPPIKGKFKGETGIDLAETIRQAQMISARDLVPSSVVEEIEQQRQQVQETGQMPADISVDQIAESGAGLKLQNTAAKHFPDLALEKLGRADFFPGVRPTQEVGFVSGRIIGRQPIFVASGGLFPFGITEARKRALEKAAQVKLAAKSAILQGGPTTKKQYQRQLDNIWVDFTNDWGEKVNQNFGLLKGNSEFIEEATSIITLGKEIEFLVDASEGILDDLNKDRFVPEDIEMLAIGMWSGQIKLEDMLANPKKFIEASKKLQSYSNLTNIIRTEVMPQLEDSINEVIDTMSPEAMRIIRRTNDYDLILKTIREEIDPEVLTGWASYIKDDFKVFQPEKEIENRLLKIFGGKIKQSIIARGKFNLSARRSLRRRDPKTIPAETGRFNFTDKVTVDDVTTEKIVPLETVNQFNFAGTSNQPKGVNIVPNIFIDPTTDKKQKVVGALNVDLIKAVDFLVDPAQNNKIVFEKGTGDIPRNTKGLRQEKFVVIIANEDNDKMGVKAGDTKLIPFEAVKQTLINSGITLKGNVFVVEGEELKIGNFGGIFEIE